MGPQSGLRIASSAERQVHVRWVLVELGLGVKRISGRQTQLPRGRPPPFRPLGDTGLYLLGIAQTGGKSLHHFRAIASTILLSASRSLVSITSAGECA